MAVILGNQTPPAPTIPDAYIPETKFTSTAISNSIHNAATKSSINLLDEIVIADSNDNWSRKKLSLATLRDGLFQADSSKANVDSPALTGSPTAPTPIASSNSNAIATTAYTRLAIPNIIHSATKKSTINDNDELGLVDSTSSYSLKRIPGSSVKSWLKAYFDTIYLNTNITASQIGGAVIGTLSGNAAGVVQEITTTTRASPTILGSTLRHQLTDTGVDIHAFIGVVGVTYHVISGGAGRIVQSANLNILQTGNTITTALNDTFDVYIAADKSIVFNYQKANGEALVSLPGPQGIQGVPGPQGIQGVPGPQGIQGVPGQGLGYGQTWKSKSGKALNTVYTNSGSVPIMVYVRVKLASWGYYVVAEVDSIEVDLGRDNGSEAASNVWCTVSFVVPAGSNYTVKAYTAGGALTTGTINKWSELS